MRFRSIVYPECPLVDAVSPLEAYCDVVKGPRPMPADIVEAMRRVKHQVKADVAALSLPHFLRRPIEHIDITAPEGDAA